jgi:arsenite-transporting ATPase
MSRIIIFTGKGGVGKSSTAAAHAVKAAKEGLKTIIVSTDMAHNLCDIFNIKIGEEPTQIDTNLYGLEIDANHEMERHYGTLLQALRNMLPSKLKDTQDDLEDIVVFPGIEELFSLIRIKEIYEERNYDLIIVDCAPTGETLSLLKFPELLSWYMEKLFPIGKLAMKVLRPISKVAFQIEMPDSKAMNDIEKLYLELGKLSELLKNREICSIRIVTIPEKMIVEETKRNYMYLNLYNFNVDALYINRLIPAEMDNEFFHEWRVIQEKYEKELKEVFWNIPLFKIRWYETEITGIEGLYQVAKDSLQEDKLFQVLITNSNETFEKIEKGYMLTLEVPFANKEGFDLYESGTDIIIKIGNFKRNIPIPNVIQKYEITSAKLDEGKLRILFS